MIQSSPLAAGAKNVNELVQDVRVLSRVWDLYGGLLKKRRLVHSSVEKTSFFNSI